MGEAGMVKKLFRDTLKKRRQVTSLHALWADKAQSACLPKQGLPAPYSCRLKSL